MPRKTKEPTVADFHALWRALSTADKAECRRWIDKRHSRWKEIDEMMLLLYDLYKARYGLRPIRYFKWLGAVRRSQDDRLLLGDVDQDSAWRRLYNKYRSGNYEKLARPAWFDDPKLIVLPPPLPSAENPPPPAIGYPPINS
jgi:hypothetical protein